MEMTDELKTGSDLLVQHFLDSMPMEEMRYFAAQKLHVQLSYFYCWATLMKEEMT